MRHRWLGWREAGTLSFETPQGARTVSADAVLLALGGGSWARLGSDAKWVPLLARYDVPIAPLQPANCGFDVGWSEYFRARFAGDHLKSIAITVDNDGNTLNEQPGFRKQGEFVVTAHGVEGSLIYALAAGLRDRIVAEGSVVIHLDLLPDWPLQRVIDEVSRPRGARSWSSHLQSRLGLKGVKTGLLRELVAPADFIDPLSLANAIKALPLTLLAPRPIDEAISSAGGVTFEGLDQHLMLKAMPGVFCAGEMLDWEAPTGGYLLSACLASGRVAGNGALSWLQRVAVA
ncbi:flavo, TIGR03862 family protein [Collimonas arenae]|nr:flavo, TIGR03862 family protein [Collimonas arenae]